ncbi:hypothetical protein COY95_03090 [Candidatus Woesearchaeota archaeon CG_4_10_14_0_8_um_filter_47_5]|nr:MAG: hypothetical protein COY95_03090 [Candidatus Woesearchaeota archaeon CG_4_10_14_0_8_um_filter_47_5]
MTFDDKSPAVARPVVAPCVTAGRTLFPKKLATEEPAAVAAGTAEEVTHGAAVLPTQLPIEEPIGASTLVYREGPPSTAPAVRAVAGSAYLTKFEFV